MLTTTPGPNTRARLGLSLLALMLPAAFLVALAPPSHAVATDPSYGWGANDRYQLGTGNTTDSNTPTTVVTDEDFLTVAAGGTFLNSISYAQACGLTGSGAVFCWGYNQYGQVGNGTTTNGNIGITLPTRVVGPASGSTFLENATDVDTGRYHSCAVASGDVYCWGRNDYGQLGDGSTTDSSRPVQVQGLLSTLTISQVATGDTHTCALATTQNIYCWGSNGNGELGNGTTTQSSVPVRVVAVGESSGGDPLPLSNVTAVTAGYDGTCALISGGTVNCWGFNGDGELGADSLSNQSDTPLVVVGTDGTGQLSGIVQVERGLYTRNACAVSDSGTAYCWGDNEVGQLGNGNTGTDSRYPVTVSALTNASEISMGYGTACARTTSGYAYCWGRNSSGSLGNGTSTGDVNSPVQVLSGAQGSGTYLANVRSIAVGAGFALAATSSSNSDASASPDPLDFGNQAVGTTSSTQTVTVTSSGTADLVIGSGATSITGSDAAMFTIDTDNCSNQTLTPTSTCTILVAFTPTAGGSATATLELASDASTTPTQVALSGFGTTTVQASASPGTLSFGSQAVGTTSSAQTVTITSIGTADLVMGAGATSITGSDAAMFAIDTDNCSSQTLTPTSTCTILVTFTPTSTGEKSATLNLASNDPSSPTTVTLTGGEEPVPQAEIFTFWFDTSTGGTCLDSVQVTDTHIYRLPDASVACVPEGSELVGWSIPGQTWNFAPGAEVVVSGSQTFTAVALAPDVVITYDSNVSRATKCIFGRKAMVVVPRDGNFAEWSFCTPQGYELVGWTDSTLREDAETYLPGDAFPEDWFSRGTNPLNTVHLYAVWKYVG